MITSVLLSFSSLAQRTTATSGITKNSKLRFLSEYDVAYHQVFRNTIIGGLSGIDYDAKQDVYYLISDDRSAINPARFYTAKISITSNRIDSVQFVNVTTLHNAAGAPYPSSSQDAQHTPDPEALRYDAQKNRMLWTSEGERIVKENTIVLEDPAVTLMDTSGNYMDTFPLSPNLHMQRTEKGPRQNGVFEGLSFADDYATLYVSVEEPLYEDGPRAGLGDTTGWIRILKYKADDKKPVAQYAYQIEPVAHPAGNSGAFKINGVSDILSVGKNSLLVIERSFSTGYIGCTIRVFLADLSKAADISAVRSLQWRPPAHPITKKMLLNMDSLKIYIDNIEGVTFGPTLPNGHRTLVFVSDNNFSFIEKTQFLLFEIIP